MRDDDEGSGSDWDVVDESPVVVHQDKETRDHSAVIACSERTGLDYSQQSLTSVECEKNVDSIDDFDDLIIDDDIQLSQSQSLTISNVSEGGGPTLITLESMKYKQGDSTGAVILENTKFDREEIAEDNCFAHIDDDGIENDRNEHLENNFNFRGTLNSEDEVSSKTGCIGIEEKDIADGKDKRQGYAKPNLKCDTSTVFISNKSINNARNGDLENWDDDFSDVDEKCNDLAAKTPLSPHPCLEKSIASTSSTNFYRKPMSVADAFLRKHSPRKHSPRMTLFTLSAPASNRIHDPGINRVQLPTCNLDSQGSMMYDAIQQKWVNIDATDASEDIDWGDNDDDDPIYSPVDNTNEMQDFQDNNDNKKSSGPISHERMSSKADFEITAEVESKLYASKVHHDILFNNFLGKESYNHYIEKFSSRNPHGTPHTATNVNKKSSSSILSKSGIIHKHKRDSTRGLSIQQNSAPSSAIHSLSPEDGDVSCQIDENKNTIDIGDYRIELATKIGSRKHKMLTEIWKEFAEEN